MFKIISIILGILIISWFLISKFSSSDPEIIAKNGLHWHSNLTISVLGEPQDIPAGIGLERLPHKPIHTHDRDNVIHLEFSGTVKKEDIKLGKFFQVWGKPFPEGKVSMLVNGKENSEFENYLMQDGDKIEIIFE